jgi:hypothetical protein
MLFPVDVENENVNIVDFCDEILGFSLYTDQRIIATTICDDAVNLNPAEYLYMKNHSNYQNKQNYNNYGFTLKRGHGKTFLMSIMIAYEIWNIFDDNEEIPKKDKTILIYNINNGLSYQPINFLIDHLRSMNFDTTRKSGHEIFIKFRGQEINIFFTSSHSRIMRGFNPDMIYYDNCFLYNHSFWNSQFSFYYDVKKRIFVGTSGNGSLSSIFNGLYLNF